jgi:Recombinase
MPTRRACGQGRRHRPHPASWEAGALRAAIGRNAERHARVLAPVVEDIRSGGATSLRAIAAELNDRGMLTRRGGRWHVSTVKNLLDRLGLQLAASAGQPQFVSR